MQPQSLEQLMADKPLPFIATSQEVRDILSGRRSQFSRIVKNLDIIQYEDDGEYWFEDRYGDPHKSTTRCPYGGPGTTLYVRETWSVYESCKYWTDCGYEYDGDFIKEPIDAKLKLPKTSFDMEGLQRFVVYKATDSDDGWSESEYWRPSIHMPRWASRISLEVTNVRIEKLHAIKPEDAVKEGFQCPQHRETSECNCVCSAFETRWRSEMGDDSWNKNPYVWRVEFKVVGNKK